MIYSNIYYFKRICKIGGTEQFLYEIAKKYGKYDITIFFREADEFQLQRLRKYIRCKKYTPGMKIKCKKAFFNWNIDIIDNVEAEEYIFVSHAIFQELGYTPPILNDKLNRFIGVSKYACNKLDEYAIKLGRKIHTELFYDPLTIEQNEKVIHLISATRLNDRFKGTYRMQQLIKALDEYCEKNNRNYIWTIFTNEGFITQSKNVVFMQQRVDIRPYISDADFMVQLSDDIETYCYSLNEALSYGTRIIRTPFTVFKEFKTNKNMEIILDWDLSNIDSVVKQIFKNPYTEFEYKPPTSDWSKILDTTKSTYTGEIKSKVIATNKYIESNISDKELNRIPLEGDEWKTSEERANMLFEKGYVKIIE